MAGILRGECCQDISSGARSLISLQIMLGNNSLLGLPFYVRPAWPKNVYLYHSYFHRIALEGDQRFVIIFNATNIHRNIYMFSLFCFLKMILEMYF